MMMLVERDEASQLGDLLSGPGALGPQRRAQRVATRTAGGALGAAILGVAALIWMDARPPSSGYAAGTLMPLSASFDEPALVPGPVSATAVSHAAARSEPPKGAAVDRHFTLAADPLPRPVDPAVRRQQAGDLLVRARAEASRGRLAESRLLYEDAIDLDPAFADARYGLALVLIRLGDREAARLELDELERLDSNLANLLGNLLR